MCKVIVVMGYYVRGCGDSGLRDNDNDGEGESLISRLSNCH